MVEITLGPLGTLLLAYAITELVYLFRKGRPMTFGFLARAFAYTMMLRRAKAHLPEGWHFTNVLVNLFYIHKESHLLYCNRGLHWKYALPFFHKKQNSYNNPSQHWKVIVEIKSSILTYKTYTFVDFDRLGRIKNEEPLFHDAKLLNDTHTDRIREKRLEDLGI